MEEKNYRPNLLLFKAEVNHQQEPWFTNVDGSFLCGEPLNGVALGYTIEDPCARKLIHYIGLKHELLVLCPNDIIDIDVKEGRIVGSFIRSDFGKLQIKP